MNSNLLENKNQEEKKEKIKSKESSKPSEEDTREYQEICGKTPGIILITKKQKQRSQTEFNKKIAYFENKEYEEEERNKVKKEKAKRQDEIERLKKAKQDKRNINMK